MTTGGALHSHVSGVSADARGRGVGRALKRHQRVWALTPGVGTVTWTFDPLLHRNARFDLAVLGAVADGYLPAVWSSRLPDTGARSTAGAGAPRSRRRGRSAAEIWHPAPMRSDVQVLVDRLADELGRSVTLCDRDDDLVAYSDLIGPVDEPRRRWVLTRGQMLPGEEPLREFASTRPGTLVRVPAGESGDGSLARLIGVVRDGQLLLGAVCVIDEQPPLTPRQEDLLTRAVHLLRPLLRRDHEAAERRLEEHSDLLRSLLGPDPQPRRDAVGAILDGEVLAATGPCSVVVASLDGDVADAALAEARQVVREALHHGRLRHGTRRALGAVLNGRGVLVLLGDGSDVDTLAYRLHDEVSNRLRSLHGGIAIAVAVSDPQPSLDDVHLAYGQALRVCRVATAVGGFDTVVTSAVVGVYDVLGRLPESALTRSVLPPGLLRLVDRHGDSETLLRTLECYLDHAGNAVAAAQQLFVHRGTLYYRLDRIEEITGVELRDGVQRLSLHVGIKLARLAGIIR